MSVDKRRDLRDMLDELDRYFEEFEKEVTEAVRSTVFGTARPSRPFITGFSFNMGPEGKPSVQVFGDSPIRRNGWRAPINEQVVDAKDETLRLILEMPGVEKEDIKVDATEDSAVVSAERGNRRYRSEMHLKEQVRPDTGKAEYRNGMLMISFFLKDKANKGTRRVNVV